MAPRPDLFLPESILLVEDQPIVRDSLLRALAAMYPTCRFLEAGNAEEALAILAKDRPTLVLSDISLPEINGLQLLGQIKARWPSIPVVMLSVHADPTYIKWSLEGGAAGYVTKSDNPEELQKAIESAIVGDCFLSPEAGASLADAIGGTPPPWASHLAPKEVELLNLLSQGLRVVEIAKKISSSTRTVSTHKRRLFEKMEWQTDRDMFVFLAAKGLIS